MRNASSLASSLSSSKHVTESDLRSFEQRLKPFFEEKARKDRTLKIPKSAYTPSQGDLFMIARYWNRLSTAFKTLYERSLDIPSDMKMYISPGGNFEIYYATSGYDSVDAADAYGYSRANWRSRTSGPNGTPDYIDDVAWAFDSAWSMEVDGFQFVKPLPYIDDSRTSNRFKVIVRNMDSLTGDTGFYGLTTPAGTTNNAAIGLRCYIEIRNEWSYFDQPDYAHHPELAVHVTAVHEFFHAIQYAMIRQESGWNSDYKIDDFPLSWLEGTAGLMENIGFDSVNDYVQYSDVFFDNPAKAILNNDDPYTYTTVLLAMFLYERLEENPSIEFVRRMFFNNYDKYLDFLSNLDSTSKTFNRPWADIFGDFFTRSYYTGDRARPEYFIHDARLFGQWPVDNDTLDLAYSINKAVPPFGMGTYFLTQQKYPFADGTVHFIGDSATSAGTSPFWSVHCVLRPSGKGADSLFVLPVSSSGRAASTTADWSRFEDAVLIVSNARGDKSRSASLVFEHCPVTIHAGDSVTFDGKVPMGLSSASSLSIAVKGYADLSCSLSMSPGVMTSVMITRATSSNLTPVASSCAVSFPKTWSESSTMTATIADDSSTFGLLQSKYQITSSALAVYYWNNSRNDWEKTVNTQVVGNRYVWQFPLKTPALYGIFAKVSGTEDTMTDYPIYAFPNPVRRKNSGRLTICGKSLMQLLVYSVNGTLTYQWETATPIDSIKWDMTNSAGRPVAPGMYFATIGYKDTVTKGLKKKRQKVIIAP